MKEQHTITDRELHTLVQEYLGRHPRLAHLAEDRAESCAVPAASGYTGPRKPRAASERPKMATESLRFASPYRCEPCKWGIEELPVPWPDRN